MSSSPWALIYFRLHWEEVYAGKAVEVAEIRQCEDSKESRVYPGVDIGHQDLCLFSWDSISGQSPAWPQTWNPPASAPWGLGPQARIPEPETVMLLKPHGADEGRSYPRVWKLRFSEMGWLNKHCGEWVTVTSGWHPAWLLTRHCHVLPSRKRNRWGEMQLLKGWRQSWKGKGEEAAFLLKDT